MTNDSNHKILIVDDDLRLRQQLERYLNDQGFHARSVDGAAGMDKALAFTLASRGIKTMDDLAELSVDDLNEIAQLGEERAARLIMTARAPWFSQNER